MKERGTDGRMEGGSEKVGMDGWVNRRVDGWIVPVCF